MPVKLDANEESVMISLDKRESMLHTMYQEHGLLRFRNLFSTEKLAKWNRLLDPLFQQHCTQKRKFIETDELMALNILKEVMVPKLLNVISVLDPCPVFFHCCCFEIEGNQKDYHKHMKRLEGWHREHCHPRMMSVRGCKPYSIYIYLSDVTDTDSGSFEIIPRYHEGPLESNLNSCNIKGTKGTCFLWNRALFHRLNINRSSQKQRILKLSIQTNGWANPSIQHTEFQGARSLLGNDSPALAYLLGSHFKNNLSIQTIPHPRTGDLPQITPLYYSEKTTLPNKTKIVLRRIKHKVDEVLGF
ncbi:hypothetical protein L1286_16780 [Pseudoalteromonas sp. SMS1]|uniref:hypothetical protein n=1 Tax=Pseudoalteromonas sp. SMS1 TaxID=2908894 RepID=UPI001F22E5DA|nr:hypothetical protein [Pseudoalteromonas sp. SMS1]MCF2859140.1 hypothetical protein [Pseudoalteromonas sp. SMS1]